MQRSILNKIITLSVLCLAIPAFSTPEIGLQEIIKQSKKIHITCPAIKDLKLNATTKTWSADGGWKTYSRSFAHQIKSFQGAQWNGVKLGQIICVYKATDPFAFPIKLFYNHQVISPEGEQWSRPQKNVKNCFDDRKTCRFSPLLTPKQTDPIKAAEDAKNSPANTLPEQNL